ncbi:MAG: DUF3108 domain-containing protein [Myxococcota bacterium]
MPTPTRTLTTALAAVLVASLSAAALARVTAVEPDDGVERAYRYELRALGNAAGEAVLTIGPRKRVAGKYLRAVRLEGRTRGFAAKVFEAVADGTTWLDDAWLPVAAGWRTRTDTGKSRVKATYPGNRTRGEYRKNGELKRRIDEAHDVRPLDIVSAFAWLLRTDLEADASWDRPLFDGRKIYRFQAKVGDPKEIAVPLGVRKAWPVHVKVSREDFSRRLTYWVGVDDRVPYKLVFHYGLLGEVEARLTSKREREPDA